MCPPAYPVTIPRTAATRNVTPSWLFDAPSSSIAQIPTNDQPAANAAERATATASTGRSTIDLAAPDDAEEPGEDSHRLQAIDAPPWLRLPLPGTPRGARGAPAGSPQSGGRAVLRATPRPATDSWPHDAMRPAPTASAEAGRSDRPQGCRAARRSPAQVLVLKDGALLVAERGTHDRLLRVNPTTGATTVFARGLGKPWGLAYARDGSLLVSSTNGFCRLRPHSRPTRIAAVSISPLAVLADGRVAYSNETSVGLLTGGMAHGAGRRALRQRERPGRRADDAGPDPGRDARGPGRAARRSASSSRPPAATSSASSSVTGSRTSGRKGA